MPLYRSSFQSQGTYTPATADTTVYVSTTGSDTNAGTSAATPFATIQKAINYVKTFPRYYGVNAIIQLADGTYTENPVVDACNGGMIVIQGNTVTPANVILTGAVTSTASGAVQVQYMSIQSIASTWEGLSIVGPSITFTAFAGGIHITTQGGTIQVKNSYTVSGGGGRHVWAIDGGRVWYTNGLTISFTTNITFTFNNFAVAQYASIRFHDYGTANVWNLNAHTITCTRYNVFHNGVIDTNGQATTWLPGNAVGGTSLGGLYV